jgi:hypothetical protein
MELTEDQIKERLKKASNPNISVWRKEHNSLDIYVNGGDVSSELEKVKNYENVEQEKLRKNVARSTKDLMGYIFKPLSKVFTATGSNIEIESENTTVKDAMNVYLQKLPEGISLKKWMQTYWLDPYSTDPNGVILVESNADGQAYPTYKSINVIHDYEHKWGKFEYLILDAGKMQVNDKEVKLFRVYDDVRDALYYVKDDTLVVIEEEIYLNTIGQVPAVLVSDIIDKKTGGRRSFIHPITELLKEYMRDSSVHSIYKFLHGFPIFWSYRMKCTTCEGDGMIHNESYVMDAQGEQGKKKVVCPTCNGKRLKVTSDVSDGISLPIPQNEQDPKLAPNIAGYIQPDLATWKVQNDEMREMKRDMHFSVYGTHVEDEKSNTATGRYIDAQPVNDVLRDVSDTAEKIESDIINFIGKLMYKDQFTSGKSTYGKRFMVETPDVLWEKYIEAKNLKAPISALDHLYKQFLSGEYYGDTRMMEQKMKEFFLEPFPHYSIADLKGAASPMQLQRKILFSDWINTGIDLNKDFDVLLAEFNKYVNTNKDDKVTEVPSLGQGGQVGQE